MDNGPGSARRLLGVFAHPDDEVFCAGGTMARAAQADAEVMIVSATRGERGQIRDPAAATRRTLGAVRERELSAAAAELGVQHVQVLILNGTADRLLENPDGRVIDVRRMHTGDFFGERGLVAGQRIAYVVARESLTCLVLSRTPIRPYAGRGAGASSATEPPAAGLPPGTCMVDVTSYLHRKLGALARHRTQYPIMPSMLPGSLLQSMLGTEFFRRIAGGNENAAASRWAKAPRPRRPACRPSPRSLRRHRDPGTQPPHTVAPHAALPPAHVPGDLRAGHDVLRRRLGHLRNLRTGLRASP